MSKSTTSRRSASSSKKKSMMTGTIPAKQKKPAKAKKSEPRMRKA